MRPVFYPYKMKSGSAKLLAKEFNTERVFPEGKFKNNFKRPIINWGNSQIPNWMLRWKDQVIFNKPEAVAIAANKLLTFRKFVEHGVKHPEWTTDYNLADDWVMKGSSVIGRLTLTGKGGQGIFFLEPASKKEAPLYVKYFKKKREFRVHVFGTKAISFTEKKRRVDVEVDYQIRNADNGWVFCHENVELPLCVKEEAIKAVNALGLDFGAVDIGYNVFKNEPCVFEVNTAPGIEGQTVEHYKQAFLEFLK